MAATTSSTFSPSLGAHPGFDRVVHRWLVSGYGDRHGPGYSGHRRSPQPDLPTAGHADARCNSCFDTCCDATAVDTRACNPAACDRDATSSDCNSSCSAAGNAAGAEGSRGCASTEGSTSCAASVQHRPPRRVCQAPAQAGCSINRRAMRPSHGRLHPSSRSLSALVQQESLPIGGAGREVQPK